MLSLLDMETILTYRKRLITSQDVESITKIIKLNPGKSRGFISQEVCRKWNWRQPNGVLKDMVCISLLLLLESKGFIKLPPRKCTPHNPLANRKKPDKVLIDKSSIECSLRDLFPIKLEQVKTINKLEQRLQNQHLVYRQGLEYQGELAV